MNGKFHSTVGAIAANGATLYALTWLSAGRPAEAAALAAGAWVGFFITSDIDHHNTTIEEIRIKKYFGKKAGRYWSAFWAPYEVFMGHGYWLSHVPPICTVIRLGYILLRILQIASPILILLLINDTLTQDQLLYAWAKIVSAAQSEPAKWFFLAWTFQDFLHWAADKFRIWT